MISRNLRVFTVDLLTSIALMYFTRNNNFLFQQIKYRVMVYRGTLNAGLKFKICITLMHVIYQSNDIVLRSFRLFSKNVNYATYEIILYQLRPWYD